MRIKIIIMLLAFSCTCAKGADMAVKESDSHPQGSTGSVSCDDLIRRLYLEELQREPDAAGMALFKPCLTQEGKDEQWLRQTLRHSPEGNKLRSRRRAHRLRVFAAVACLSTLGIAAFVYRRRLKELAGSLHRRYPLQRHYLLHPVSISPFAALLLFLYLYNNLNSGGNQGRILAFLVTIIASILIRLPRWLIYGTAVFGMTLLIHHFVFVDARVDDRSSDRNEAVEIGAKALLQGENPWNKRSILHLPITTGPSSMVLAIPSVYFTGTIIALSFTAWLVFLAFLLAGDIANRNNTFLLLCLLMLFPWMDFLHTWHWALDELYYPVILSPLLWLALKSRRLLIAGCICGFMLLSRLSYAFAVLPAGFWWFFSERRRRRECIQLTAGGLIFCLLTMGVLCFIGGRDFFQANFFLNSQVNSLSSHANWFVHSITVVLGFLPHGNIGSALVISCILLIASVGMRTVAHPFFHISLGLLLAHRIGFNPASPNDYMLVFVIPAMYGIAFYNTDRNKEKVIA